MSGIGVGLVPQGQWLQNPALSEKLVPAIVETLLMVGFSGIVTVILGLPLGLLLASSAKNGLRPRPVLHQVLSAVVNVVRSFPFIILIVALIPLTRLITGTSLGWQATVVPLSIGAIPFFARLVESNVAAVPLGKIEAAQMLGASPLQIQWGVQVREARSQLVHSVTLLLITLVGYSAMAGAVGGGGLGQMAINYGYVRFQNDVMITTVVVIVILVQLIQMLGDLVAALITPGARRGRVNKTAKNVTFAVLGVAILVGIFAGVQGHLGAGFNQTSAGQSRDAEDETVTLVVGASPSPQAKILEYVQKELAENEGLNIQVREFSDYVQPNEALANGELDANFYQTVPYLESESASRGYHFDHGEGIHLEPLGIYSKKIASLEDLPKGGKIGIIADPENQRRGLELLAAEGLVELPEDQEATANTVKKLKDFTFLEVEGPQLVRSLADVDAAVINGNYAAEGGLSPANDALAVESAEGNPAVNVLVWDEATGQRDATKLAAIEKLDRLLRSKEVADYIRAEWQDGSVIPAAG